jgi:hypothetical protein
MDEVYYQWLKDRPTYKRLRDWNSGLIRLTLDKHPTADNKMTGHVSRVVTGDAGIGKSTYSYKILAKVHYTMNGYTKVDEEEYSYKFALDNMIYRPRQLFDQVRIQRALDTPALAWCIDDASVHMGRQLFDQDREGYRNLQGIVPTLREDVTLLLITTINVGMLAKPWREFIRKKVHIQSMGALRDYKRLAKHYEKWYYPDDIRFRINIPFQDKFSCLIPEPFYSWYHKKKMDALNEYLNSIADKPKVRDSDIEIGEDDEKS